MKRVVRATAVSVISTIRPCRLAACCWWRLWRRGAEARLESLRSLVGSLDEVAGNVAVKRHDAFDWLYSLDLVCPVHARTAIRHATSPEAITTARGGSGRWKEISHTVIGLRFCYRSVVLRGESD